ncbi:hypothetical protein BP5796_00063 [Coleophoma crateriformis]|uniref:Heterokaryon incompatibility domain-containing protein n=1 Tax=Coleophoma crateriformis TaxID=565419 RepID=A0A3D8T6Z8_9HELO|nr:hypothetical protein BP5796_00063 [Coleophoma crateriformis]
MLSCQLESLRDTFTAIFDEISNEERQMAEHKTIKYVKDEQDNGEPWFWIDVLCLPRDWERKMTLLNQLHTIYKEATAVLIWDRNLLERPEPAEKNYIEMTVRLNTGQWSRRLWTLPEAVLARRLYVAFKSGHVALNDMNKAYESAKNNVKDDYHFIWKAGRLFTSSITEIRCQMHTQELGPSESDLEPGLPVQRARKAIQFREASHPDDQTIVLASVLGLDMSRFVNIQPVQAARASVKFPQSQKSESVATKRMVEFLNALDETPGLGIPSGLIFLPQPKLPQDGYGWAPETWMHKQRYTYPLFRPLKKTGYMMPHGLHVEFPGLILHCPTPVISQKDFWIPVAKLSINWVKGEIDGAGTNVDHLRDHLKPSDEHCIILNAEKTRERWEAGLFVKRKGTLACGKVWRVTICRVWVRLETRTSKLQKLKADFQKDVLAQYFGERVDSQRWCIEESLLEVTKL